tara:strand:- start:365 stop:814 length:450 start_codon:yes stop_codon:yes gene_type:complete
MKFDYVPTRCFANHIALHMRLEDQEEIMLSHGITPVEAINYSYDNSEICHGIEGDDGMPVGLMGICGDRIWMLGTEEIAATKNHRLQLCLQGRRWVDSYMKGGGKPIGNHVFSKNKMSIKWLEHLGFSIEEPAPFGPFGALFCQFWRTA